MNTIEIADRVIYGMDSFGRKPQSWRVTGFYRRIEDSLDNNRPEQHKVTYIWDGNSFQVDETEWHKSLDNELFWEIWTEDRLKEHYLRAERKLPCTRRYRYVRCRKEQATHLCLTCICGAIAPIADCTRTGTVEWEPEYIAREIKAYNDTMDRIENDPFLSRTEWMWE